MNTYSYTNLSAQQIDELCLRQLPDDTAIAERVQAIIAQVKEKGDEALIDYAAAFDKVTLQKLFIDKEEIAVIAAAIPAAAKDAIDTAYTNISKFHAAQLYKEHPVETMPGVTCWREARAIERVGLYIPGGTAVLPSTFLMLGIPAVLAGCREIVVCSPPQKDGKTNCYLAYCAVKLGIERIYLAGGAQAVAAMAFGTATVPKVYKIFGPGNRYVTLAKQQVLATGMTAIDMPAGPSEVLVIADETANPAFVASDLLAQAEHGVDSQAILIATSQAIIDETLKQIELQLGELPRKDIAAQAIANSLKSSFRTTYDDGAAIGKRYTRQDLIGTPFCVAVDYQTMEDDTVTIRHRDTMEQERVHISKLKEKIGYQVSLERILEAI